MSGADERLNDLGDSPSAAVPTARRQVTRDRLLEAAATVFRADGLQGASVEAICTQAGFSRGAFYSNFESKEQLFLGLLERELAARIAHLRVLAEELEPELLARGCALSAKDASAYIIEFLQPETDATTWYVLETELLLLALRDPDVAPGYQEFIDRFDAEFAEAVSQVLSVSGRRFTLPAAQAVEALGDAYKRQMRIAALSQQPVHTHFDDMGERLASLLFAITEPQQAAKPGA